MTPKQLRSAQRKGGISKLNVSKLLYFRDANLKRGRQRNPNNDAVGLEQDERSLAESIREVLMGFMSGRVRRNGATAEGGVATGSVTQTFEAVADPTTRSPSDAAVSLDDLRTTMPRVRSVSFNEVVKVSHKESLHYAGLLLRGVQGFCSARRVGCVLGDFY